MQPINLLDDDPVNTLYRKKNQEVDKVEQEIIIKSTVQKTKFRQPLLSTSSASFKFEDSKQKTLERLMSNRSQIDSAIRQQVAEDYFKDMNSLLL